MNNIPNTCTNTCLYVCVGVWMGVTHIQVIYMNTWRGNFFSGCERIAHSGYREFDEYFGGDGWKDGHTYEFNYPGEDVCVCVWCVRLRMCACVRACVCVVRRPKSRRAMLWTFFMGCVRTPSGSIGARQHTHGTGRFSCQGIVRPGF